MPAEPPSRWPATALAALADAASLIESRVVAIGADLDAALVILARQGEAFETLVGALGGPVAERAAIDLTAALADVARDAAEHAGASKTLDALAATLGRLRRRAATMRQHAATALVLAMYTRLEGSRLGQAGAEFVAFAQAMRPSVEQVQLGLAAFEREIAEAATLIDAALRDHTAFAAAHLATLDHAAARLASNLDMVRSHRRHVAACGAHVAEGARRMQIEVAQAVMALQIGDSTRQRLEHMHALVALLAGSTEAAAEPGAGDLLAAGGLLARRQLEDAASEFTRHVADAAASFHALARDAADIVRAGAAASGRADRGGRSGLCRRVLGGSAGGHPVRHARHPRQVGRHAGRAVGRA